MPDKGLLEILNLMLFPAILVLPIKNIVPAMGSCMEVLTQQSKYFLFDIFVHIFEQLLETSKLIVQFMYSQFWKPVK